MTKLESLAFTSLVVCAAACGEVITDDTSGAAGDDVALNDGLERGKPAAPVFATSCAEVRAHDNYAEDAEYTLYLAGDEARPFTVWCQDMAGTPLEYLKLEHVQGDSNYAQYSHGGPALGTSVRTHYFYLRLDPQTLLVDTSDQRFAMSDGAINHPGGVLVTSMPYGVAMSCNIGGDKGLANIDLRGTHFAVADTFQIGGSSAFGTIIPDAAMTVIDLVGGGQCGWMAPTSTAFNPMNTAGGALHLVWAP